MSADDEYTAFVGTRWAALVRATVLLGCPRHDAEDLVRSVLVRGYRGWEAAWRDNLNDVHVACLLLSTVRSRRDDTTAPTAEDLPAVAYAVDQHARTDLVRVLELLDETGREALVLRHVLELTPAQAARVLGVPVVTLDERLVEALASIPAVDEPEPLTRGGDTP